MVQFQEKPERRSIRLKEYDYTQPGAYFITLVAFQRQSLFGKINDGAVVLSDLGDLANAVWFGLETRFSMVKLDEFTIMPNHLHGIIFINGESVGAGQEEDTWPVMNFEAPPVSDMKKGPSLGEIVRTYKGTVARLHNRLNKTQGKNIWQRNYYERVIRDEMELDQTRLYIQENPVRWEEENADRYPWEK